MAQTYACERSPRRVPRRCPPPRRATPDAHQGRQHPLPRRGRRRVRRQVGHRLRRDRPASRSRRSCARRSAGCPTSALRRRARDRRRHRLLLAQPAAARADRAGDRDRHLARDARARSRAPPTSSASRSRPSQTEAEQLPFADESFDLVFGHAVLHHIPDLDRAFAEFRRVLRPGGAIAFCGEPSRYGDRLAALPKRAGLALAPAWRRALAAPAAARVRRRPRQPTATRSRARSTSTPSPPPTCAGCCASAGFEQPRVGGEELLANAWGWGCARSRRRAEPEAVPLALAQRSPSAATSRCRGSTPRCSSRGCPPSSSTTCCSRRASRPERT